MPNLQTIKAKYLSISRQMDVLTGNKSKSTAEWEQYYTLCEQLGSTQKELNDLGIIYNNISKRFELIDGATKKAITEFIKNLTK